MKTIGIIAEFNPFHNGHKYLIDEAKKITGADNVIIICSGNYVQRGMPAIWDKSIRTKMALSNGADAVFELPVYYSTASAETFARASVKFLDDLNCIDYLCFGCEVDNYDIIPAVANILYDEPAEYKNYLSENLKTGISYPKARANALSKYCTENGSLIGDQIEQLMSMPNNILAIEYLKAINLFNSSIKPVPIKRIGAEYHSKETNLKFASATGIRNKLVQQDFNEISDLIPDNCVDALPLNKIITLKDFDTILGAKLLSTNDFSDIYGVNEELSNRIKNIKSGFIDFESFIEKLQSKNYTYSAISRALLHIVLDLKTTDVEEFIDNNYFSFARLIGFNKNSDILSIIKENSSLNIISKLSTYYNNADVLSRKMLDISIKADELYRMIYMNKYNEYIPTEFERQIAINNVEWIVKNEVKRI